MGGTIAEKWVVSDELVEPTAKGPKTELPGWYMNFVGGTLPEVDENLKKALQKEER